MNKNLILLILAAILPIAAGCAINPVTGKRELMLIPEEQDVEIGKKYAPEIEKQMGGRIPDPAIQAYVNSIGQKVAKVSHKPNIEYSYVALQDKNINAFALPGGFIFVTKGMLQSLRTEAQLAGILAHETVHVVARDSANAMSKEIGFEMLMSAVTSEKSPGGGLATVAQLSTQILSLKYSRSDEQDADLGALEYLVAAGYTPYAMVESMSILAAQNEQRPIEFLSTHPHPESRSEYLKKKIATMQFNLQNAKVGKEEYRSAILTALK